MNVTYHQHLNFQEYLLATFVDVNDDYSDDIYFPRASLTSLFGLV